eukprot:SAG11_NODE_12977_length_676_cov_0.953206_1_plen_40_part_10
MGTTELENRCTFTARKVFNVRECANMCGDCESDDWDCFVC